MLPIKTMTILTNSSSPNTPFRSKLSSDSTEEWSNRIAYLAATWRRSPGRSTAPITHRQPKTSRTSSRTKRGLAKTWWASRWPSTTASKQSNSTAKAATRSSPVYSSRARTTTPILFCWASMPSSKANAGGSASRTNRTIKWLTSSKTKP